MKPDDKKKEARKISIVTYLESLGFNYTKSSGSYYYYLSPLPGRNERKPSFLVRKKDNKWNDRGIDQNWDDIISLVMKIENINYYNALDVLLEKRNDRFISFDKIDYNNESNKRISIIIKQVSELKNKILINYLLSRKINIDIAKFYCKEAWIQFPLSKYNPQKLHLVIAFKNSLGGYEMRNSYLKISNSPKYYTFISGENSDRDIFEGFINFLSLLTYKNILKTKNNVYVLNSLIYLPYIYDYLRQTGTNNLYLDYGNSAEKQINLLKENDIKFNDRRDLFLMYGDLNDMLCRYARLK